MKKTKQKTLALLAPLVLACAGLASCADENLVNKNGGESVNPADFKLATSTVTFSADAGMQLPNVTRALDPDAPATRAVSLNERYMLMDNKDHSLNARVFVVRVDKNAKKTINGEEAVDPSKIVMGAGDIKWDNVRELPGGGVHLDSKESLLTLTWLDGNSVVINPKEEWYICGIIGGEYNEYYKRVADKERKKKKEERNEALIKLYDQLYHFYVKMNPSSEHNTRDKNGRLRVTAAFSTGWTRLKVEKANVINLRKWAFEAMGTLLHFKVKRNTELVKPEAHKYTFASSQLTANGGFMMMPLELYSQGGWLEMDHEKGLDCEIRPWEKDIDRNFYWQYKEERHLHFNNITDTDPNSEDEVEYGAPFYEYRYTYDAEKMRGPKADKDYDEFYVWGMPIPYPNYNGTTQITAERGSFMLGRKQPKGSKYDYADEWLYAKAVNPETNSNEYKLKDFTDKKFRGKAFSIELGVCRPRFSAKNDDGTLKYAWPNPLERLAVTNSMTAEKGWHDTNTQHSNTSDWGNVKNWSIKNADLKYKFVIGGKDYLPANYHVPNSEEWGCAIPNILTSIYERHLVKDLMGWDYIKPGATPWYEMYNPGKDDLLRPVITAGETHNSNKSPIHEEFYWNQYPVFFSYFMQDREKGEMFAIRFDGTNKEAKFQGHTLGQRYRCAYRWRLINVGGPEGSNDDTNCMRLVVQSRWIGNANVGLKDIKDDAWWGKSSPDNPLFETDCYRVLPCAGNPHSNGKKTWYINYWSRTRWKFPEGSKDTYDSNKTFCYRRIGKDGFNRGHHDNQRDYFPVRLIVNRDVDEFGGEAPRRKQHDKDQTMLISRKADGNVTNWDWTPKLY